MLFKLLSMFNNLFEDIRIAGIISFLLGFNLWFHPNSPTGIHIVETFNISLEPLIWFMILCGAIMIAKGNKLETLETIALCSPLFFYMIAGASWTYKTYSSYNLVIKDIGIILFIFSKRIRIVTANIANKILK